MVESETQNPLLTIAMPSKPFSEETWLTSKHSSSDEHGDYQDEREPPSLLNDDYWCRSKPSIYTWWTDSQRSTIQIFIVASSILNEEPTTSPGANLSRMRLHDDDTTPMFATLPTELIIKFFKRLTVLDRVHLASCNKNLAKIATNNQLLYLTEQTRYTLCGNTKWFSTASVKYSGTPGCCCTEEPGWQRHAKTAIEGEGGLFTHGIMFAVQSWWIWPELREINGNAVDYFRGLELDSNIYDRGRDADGAPEDVIGDIPVPGHPQDDPDTAEEDCGPV